VENVPILNPNLCTATKVGIIKDKIPKIWVPWPFNILDKTDLPFF
jgi:hypothetical protein